MKKKVVVVLLAGLMCMNTLISMAAETPATEKESETESEIAEEVHPFFQELVAKQFVFSSGAGGWATMMNVNARGQFSGEFFDGEMGMIGEGYPNGTVYLSNFSGQFGEPVQMNEYTWAVKVEEIAYEEEVGTEEIKDEVLYYYTTPYGLEGAEELLIYLPGAPLEELPEEYLSWVGYFDLQETEDTELKFYGIYNEVEQCGFSSYDLIDSAYETLGYIEESSDALKAELQKDTLTQMELNEKTLLLYEVWDGALNQIWGILKVILPKEEMQALTEEELAWIDAKEQAIKEAGAEFAGGSMQAMIMNDVAATWTEERVYELLEILDAGRIIEKEKLHDYLDSRTIPCG